MQFLLSDGETSKKFNLIAYCHENQLLVYKLDDEAAVVLISAVIKGADDTSWTLVAERMQKIKERDIGSVKTAMKAELALTTDACTGPTDVTVEPPQIVENIRGLKRARSISNWPSSPRNPAPSRNLD